MKEIVLKFKNIISLLENKQKRSLVYIFVIYLISIVLDVLGIGLIIPILSLILSGEINQNFLNYLPIKISYFETKNLVLIVLTFFSYFIFLNLLLVLLHFGITEDLFISYKRT